MYLSLVLTHGLNVSLLPVNKTTFKVLLQVLWLVKKWLFFYFDTHSSSCPAILIHLQSLLFYTYCHLLHFILSFLLYSHLQGSVYHCWSTSTGRMYPQENKGDQFVSQYCTTVLPQARHTQRDYSHSVYYFYYTAAKLN